MSFVNRFFPALAICLILLPFALLHFHSGNFFLTHDGPFHIERTFNLLSLLREGNFPPSWTNLYNSGFGSPIFLYLFPVPYIISVLLALTGLDLVSVLKLDFLFWSLVAGTGTYFFLRRGLSFSRPAALVGSVFYLYAPAMLAQVFVRGSLREFAGAAVFPLVLLALKRLADRLDPFSLGATSLTLAVFALTDGITVVTFLPVVVVFAVFLIFQKNRSKLKTLAMFAASSLIALLICSYIYLPFLLEMKFLKGPTSYYLEHFVYWWQLFDYHWGFGFSLPGPNDSMSFQLGVINLIALAAGVFFWLKKRLSITGFEKLFLFCLIGYLVLMVESPVSHLLWQLLSPLQLVQLPWRLLLPIALIFSILAASVVNQLRLSSKWVGIIFLGVLLVSFRYLRTNQIFVFEPGYLLKNSGDATAYHEFIPIWRSNTSQFADFPKKVETVTGQVEIKNLSEKNSQISFQTDSDAATRVRINTLYYPGWEALVDGQKKTVMVTTNQTRPKSEKRDLSGLMEISVPEGRHDVVFHFGDTPVRRISKWLTLGGLISCGALIATCLRKNPK